MPEPSQGLPEHFRENNFDVLRILFALEVVLFHANEHLGTDLAWIRQINIVPGVPAFFFVSGFLITASFLNSGSLKVYVQNCVLRIYPGLIAVTLLSIGFLVACYGPGWLFQNVSTIGVWSVAQLTIGQGFNPKLFREFGVGVVNGSLWTITVELLFYVMLPIVILVGRTLRRTQATALLMGLIAWGFYVLSIRDILPAVGSKNLGDYLLLTPLTWGWMFAVGMLVYLNFGWCYRHRHGLGIGGILGMVLIWVLSTRSSLPPELFEHQSNQLGLLYYLSFMGVVFWLAYAFPVWKLTGDYSYGIYIYHMPVVNLLLEKELPQLVTCLAITVLLAVLSWHLIESPALKLKKKKLSH